MKLASHQKVFFFQVIESIKSSEVEQTLLVLPFDYTMRLLRVMERLLGASKSVEVRVRETQLMN